MCWRWMTNTAQSRPNKTSRCWFVLHILAGCWLVRTVFAFPLISRRHLPDGPLWNEWMDAINETNTDDIAVMVSGNVDDHLAEGREVFNYFDSRGDERINVSQVGDVLRALGQNPTEADIKNCCAQWKEPDHRITFEEFVPIFQTINNSRAVPSIEEFIEGLSHFDKDGNGNINVAELRHLLTTLGERLSDEEADQLLAGHEDSHGNVNIADFVRHVSQR